MKRVKPQEKIDAEKLQVRKDALKQHSYWQIKSQKEWKECCICGLEFKNEPGWGIRDHYKSKDIYACQDCLHSEENVLDYLEKAEKEHVKSGSSFEGPPPIRKSKYQKALQNEKFVPDFKRSAFGESEIARLDEEFTPEFKKVIDMHTAAIKTAEDFIARCTERND
jgi:hypothetical protein